MNYKNNAIAFILCALVAGLVIWAVFEIGNHDFDPKPPAGPEAKTPRHGDLVTRERRAIGDPTPSRLEEGEPKNFVLRRQRTRPADQNSSAQEALDKPTQELNFAGEKILIGEVSVMDVETGQLTEGFGVYFNEKLGALTDGEIRIKQSSSGEIQSIYLPGKCELWSDKAFLQSAKVRFEMGEQGLVFRTAGPAQIQAQPVGEQIPTQSE